MPLQDLRVIDLSTLIAGPGCGRYLADFGASVVKVEHPDGGDPSRTMGWRDPRDDVALWWKYLGRNKHAVTIDLKSQVGREQFLSLCDESDVLIENFRPGTLERLGYDPEALIERNPTLVVVRVSGFGQTGPYARRPGFATLVEAMSGFASINGHPDGDPTLPPIALADEVTALAAAFAVMVAVHSGVGQVVDVSLLESLLHLMGPLPAAHELLRHVPTRLGSGLHYTVPRGIYRTSDGRHIALSTSSESVARRLMAALGVADDERFMTNRSRIEHRELVEGLVSAWVAERSAAEVLRELEAADAAVAQVLTIPEVLRDEHVVARDIVVDVDGVPMQNVIARLSRTPGAVRWAGRELGADNDAVLGPPC